MGEKSATFLPSSATATAIVEKAWKTKTPSDGLLVLPGVLSRKKQIIPALEAAAKAANASEQNDTSRVCLQQACRRHSQDGIYSSFQVGEVESLFCIVSSV